MLVLRQSTAVDVLIGPFVDSTDGDTEETALTIANTDVKLSKNGQTLAAKNDATTCAHDANGMYNCELDATDTNTVGTLVLFVHVSGALAARHEFQVIEEAVYDITYAASAYGPVQADVAGRQLAINASSQVDANVQAISDDATAATNMESFFDGTGYAGTNNVIPTVTTLTGHTPQTGDSFARIGANGAGLSAVPWNASWDAEVESEVNDALVALGLDHLVGAAVTGTDVTDNSIIAKLVSASATADWDDFVNTTDALQAVRDKLTDIETDTAEIGTAGAGLSNIPWNASWDAEVESEVNDALDTAISELGVAAPTATPTLRTGLMLLYMMARNKVDVDTTGTDAMKVHNDAGTQICSKAITDDGTDYSEAKMT